MVPARQSTLFITYCSRHKSRDPGDLPAQERYTSKRIRAVHAAAVAIDTRFRILSGKYGLLAADELIPWYDHLLSDDEIVAHAALILPQLRAIKPARVLFFARPAAVDPGVIAYRDAMARACAAAGTNLTVIEVNDDDLIPERLVRKAED